MKQSKVWSMVVAGGATLGAAMASLFAGLLPLNTDGFFALLFASFAVFSGLTSIIMAMPDNR